MSVYARYKRLHQEGFRALVELLETTPASRRDKMIRIGMVEDPEYTRRALEHMMTFEDITKLPDVELAEVLAKAPPRMTGYAVGPLSPEVQARFLRNAVPAVAAQVRDYMSMKSGLREVGGAQLKLVATARGLEKQGLVRIKRIPTG